MPDYDRVIQRLPDHNESLDELYPHVMELFGQSGWDDPAMDVYNELDPRRQS
jgi:hypothetical protein